MHISTTATGRPRPALAVSAPRALASADSGRVLQVVHALALTLPAGLPQHMAVQIIMPAAQVLAGGALVLTLGAGVTANGTSDNTWAITRTVGSTAPWMAWLQRAATGAAYSITAIGATVVGSAAGGSSGRALSLDGRLLSLDGRALSLT